MRARETLELMPPALSATSTLRLEPELYAATSDTLLEAVASLMLIGHNPGL